MKSGSKLRPASAMQRHKAPLDRRAIQVALTLEAKGLVQTKGAFSRLTRWLNRLAEGSEADLRTPFFALRSKDGKLVDRPRAEIVAMFDSALAKTVVKETKLCGLVREIEAEHRETIGPMSPYLPWRDDGPAKAEAVFKDKRPSLKFDKKAWLRACDRTQALVKTQSCDLLSPEDAVRGVADDPEGGLDHTTNSGAPFWISPWKSDSDKAGAKTVEVDEAYQWIMKRVKELIPFLQQDRSINELPLWYTTAGQRLVQKGPKPFSPKSKRLVEAYPKEEAILAAMATPSIMDALRLAKGPGGSRIMCAWFDLPTIDSNMQLILETADAEGGVVNSGDISNFDATVPPWALMDVGNLIATWSRGGEKLVRNLIAAMVYRTVLITPTGFYGPGPSSMKSGSGFTNLLGSMTNLTMQFYGEELGLYKLKHICVLGDDFITYGEGVDPSVTGETFSHFNMEAHPDKQYYKPGALQYLKRLHVLGRPGGIASVYRTLGSVLSLEKLTIRPKDWSKYAYEVQALSKIQNAAFNPYFTTLVNFIASGDKLHLGREMTPEELVSSAGNTGAKLLREDARRSWKQLGSGVGFADWTVNGVLRGEELPSGGRALFERVYGKQMEV